MDYCWPIEQQPKRKKKDGVGVWRGKGGWRRGGGGQIGTTKWITSEKKQRQICTGKRSNNNRTELLLANYKVMISWITVDK